MSDTIDDFKFLKTVQQARRADNREKSAEYLRQRGIPFEEKNNGAHLIVEGRDCFIDFWPGTGRWNSRCGCKGFGVRHLVVFIGTPGTPTTTNERNIP
jgi:hypothetical protein